MHTNKLLELYDQFEKISHEETEELKKVSKQKADHSRYLYSYNKWKKTKQIERSKIIDEINSIEDSFNPDRYIIKKSLLNEYLTEILPKTYSKEELEYMKNQLIIMIIKDIIENSNDIHGYINYTGGDSESPRLEALNKLRGTNWTWEYILQMGKLLFMSLETYKDIYGYNEYHYNNDLTKNWFETELEEYDQSIIDGDFHIDASNFAIFGIDSFIFQTERMQRKLKYL